MTSYATTAQGDHAPTPEPGLPDTLLRAVHELVQSVSGDAALLITRDCPLHAMDGWDWEKHVTLMLEAECRFGVRFTVSEMAYVTNVGDVVDLIYSKQVRKKESG